MDKRRLAAIDCANAVRIIHLERTNLIIPFKGEFPLVNAYNYERYCKAFSEVTYVDELDEKWQKLTRVALTIDNYQQSFSKYLWARDIEYSDFRALSPERKSEYLVAWMEEERLDFGFLNIDFDQYG